MFRFRLSLTHVQNIRKARGASGLSVNKPVRCLLPRGASKTGTLFSHLIVLAVLCCSAGLTGCSSTAGNIALGAAGATLVGARSPGQELEQTYYLGVFDPQEQLPPMVYRVRVRGQASFLSQMKFGSGWVPANLIDSLGTGVQFDDGQTHVSIKKGNDPLATLQTGRRLVLFGPEGFREAPKDHRLVIVMGSSPEKWFNAMDQSLGAVNQVISQQRNEALIRMLLSALSDTRRERLRLERLKTDVEKDFALTKEGA